VLWPLVRNGICLLPEYHRVKAISSNVLYIHPLYLSFTVSSKRSRPLYLLPLQQHPLNHVLYTQIHILETFFIFIFCAYICHTLKCIVHILVLLNWLFKVFKWIEDRLEKLYIERIQQHPVNLEDHLEDAAGEYRGLFDPLYLG
jgi:hypothetical protein